MPSAARKTSRSFFRDFGLAALIVVPLTVVGLAGWYSLSDKTPARPVRPVAELAMIVPQPSPEKTESVAHPPPPVVPFFGIRAASAAPEIPPQSASLPPQPAPAPVPEKAARASDAGWEARSVRPPAVRAGAWVAIIIDDLGLDRGRAARAASLPGPLTLSFMSYASDVGMQASAARQSGHEIMLHMPMEPEGREDPGPGALFVRLPDADIRQRVAASLDRLPMAVGLNNHMGSRFTRDARAMRPVLEEIAARGLLFVDSRTSGGSVAGDLAAQMGIANAGRDVFLDNEQEATYVRRQLAELERTATRRGNAVAIGHPHDATLDALAAWIPTMNSRGLQLVPVSAIARHLRRDPSAQQGVAQGRPIDVPLTASRIVPVQMPGSGARATPVPAPEFTGEQPWKRYPIE
jgi:polysaccharide deacetylase 2 family uncharacterized protein YibQ